MQAPGQALWLRLDVPPGRSPPPARPRRCGTRHGRRHPAGYPLAGRGELLHWHPHFHVLLTCGAFTPQGDFLELPELDLERLQTAWQEAVFALYLAEFTQHIPPKGAHLIRYYGWYSNKARGMRRKAAEAAEAAAAAVEPVAASSSGDAGPAPARSRSSQTWAMLIKRLYEIDPLICPRCSGQMKIVAFLEPPQGDVIEKILCGHRRAAMVGGLWCPAAARAPPAGDVRVHDPDSDSASQAPRELTFVDEATFWSTF